MIRPGASCCRAAREVITTGSGARRLGGNASGLAPWESTTLPTPHGAEIRITATPARHGPPLSRALVGEVIGFLLEWPGQRHGALWISGDTVYFGGVAEIGGRFNVGTALIHLGGVRFPITGPARYTMNAAEAVGSPASLTSTPCSQSTMRAGSTSARVAPRSKAISRGRGSPIASAGSRPVRPSRLRAETGLLGRRRFPCR